MKKIYFLILALIVANLALFSLSSCKAKTAAVASEKETALQCYSGGPGASSCEVPAGVDINGITTTTSCSITCADGYYACCGLTCTCVAES